MPALTFATPRLALLLLPLLAACHASPLYVGTRAVGTGGEAPRDGNGNPIFSAIRQAPANAVQSEVPQGGARQ